MRLLIHTSLYHHQNGSILVIDEIGKMELFSKPFTALVRRLFDQHSGSILATIPVARGKPLQLVDEIRKRADVNIITVRSCLNIYYI